MVKLMLATMRSLSSMSTYGKLLDRIVGQGAEVPVVVANRQLQEEIWTRYPETLFVTRGLGEWPPAYEPLQQRFTGLIVGLLRDPDFLAFKAAVIHSLDRHDAAGTFRLVDREIYFHENFFGLANVLLEQGITHILFDITPHVAREYILFWLAKKLGISIAFFQPVPFAGISIARSDLESTWEELEAFWRKKSNTDFRRMVVSQGEKLVSSLSGGEVDWVSRYQRPETDKLTRSRPFISRMLRGLSAPKARTNFVDLSGITSLHPVLRSALVEVLTFLHKRSFQLERGRGCSTTPPTRDDILLALTHQPERTYFPEALPFISQLEVVPLLMSCFPESRKIFVKEHDTQFVPGRLGYAARSTRAYEFLRRLPRVELVASNVLPRPYLESVGAVVSATGTICLEAAILGTPAYYYGNPWWEGFPGTARISVNLTQGSQPTPARKFSRREAQTFFLGLLDRSIPTTSNIEPKIFREKFAELPVGYEDLESESLFLFAQKFMRGDEDG